MQEVMSYTQTLVQAYNDLDNYKVDTYTNNSMSLKKKRRQLNETMPDKNVHDISQSDISLNENPTRNTINNKATIVQGLMGDDDKIKS